MPTLCKPQIRQELSGLRGKGEQPPALEKSLTQELLQEKYTQHSWIHAYTDRSAEKAIGNCHQIPLQITNIPICFRRKTELSLQSRTVFSPYKGTHHLIGTEEEGIGPSLTLSFSSASGDISSLWFKAKTLKGHVLVLLCFFMGGGGVTSVLWPTLFWQGGSRDPCDPPFGSATDANQS